MSKKPLTAKQEMFCREYLIDLNATQAAIRAGYSEKTAYSIANENLSKPEIIEFLQPLLEEREKRVEVDADYVLTQAKKLHERCMQEIKPLTDKKGNQLTDEEGNAIFVFDSQGAARSLELIGKHVSVQAFRDQLGISNPKGGPIELTDTQRSARIASLLDQGRKRGTGSSSD